MMSLRTFLLRLMFLCIAPLLLLAAALAVAGEAYRLARFVKCPGELCHKKLSDGARI